MSNLMGSFLIGFAIFCFILSYGLMKRQLWVWYAGLVFFFVFAGRFCWFFLKALETATEDSNPAYALVYICGGLLIWIPLLILWFDQRPKFRRSAALKAKTAILPSKAPEERD
jgi:hypothetical protein